VYPGSKLRSSCPVLVGKFPTCPDPVGILPERLASHPRRLSSFCTVRPAFASQRLDLQTFQRSDVPFPPSPPPASSPQLLLLSKLKSQLNHAESTLLQVLILKQLKVPLESITFEKPGEGSPLWLTNCSKRVSVGKVRGNPNLPSSVHTSKFRIPQPLYLPLLRKHRGCGGILPILERREAGAKARQDFADCLSIPVRSPPCGLPC